MPPPASLNDLQQRSAALLEWPTLLGALAGQAVTPAGKTTCARLPSSSDPEIIDRWYAELREWLTLHQRTGDLPLVPEIDPRPALDAARAGGVLEARPCRDVALLLEQAADVRRTIARAQEEATLPLLRAYADQLAEMPELKRTLDATLDRDGSLRETASPELRRLRAEVDRLRHGIVARVERLLQTDSYAPWLQDTFVTQREDRYVLPIKIEHRGRVEGIVHDYSASGATVFIEPTELVQANNELKWAELGLADEIERIFRDLTERIAAARPALQKNLDILTALDVIQAKGRFGLAYHGVVPEVSVEGEVAWRGLRHPLLALRHPAVVGNDVGLEAGTHAMVISGPNAGGKTVLLKAIGLAALMTRAGLMLACDAGAVAPLFTSVLVDLGDEQDLARDLSTFAGHITVVGALLGLAGPNTLVLIDELAAATDPDEGAALAQALLEGLMERGALAIVTTHFAALKAWAADGPGRVSAGLGFDVATLAPTYTVAFGRPGRSLGLDVAARLGLPPALMARARSLVAPQAAAIERAVAALEAERQAVADARRRVDELEAATREAALRQDAAAAAIERDRQAFQRDRRARLAGEIERAKQEIDAVLDAARRERSPSALRTLRTRLDALVEPPRAAPVPGATPAVLEAGTRVAIPSLRTEGVLLETTTGKERVRVRVGDRDVLVPSAQLESAAGREQPPAPRPQRAVSSEPDVPEALNLIGLRVDDALERIDRRLDEAMSQGLRRLRLVHGHGTGRLKAAIRAHLGDSPYVAAHRPGDLPEGGDAVTIVTLASAP